MKLSKLTITLGLYIIISVSFMGLVWDFLEKLIGRQNLRLLAVLFLVIVTFLVILYFIRSKLQIYKIFLALAIVCCAFFFAWRQPHFLERFHIAEYGFLGWLAMRDLNKNKILPKNIFLVVLFVSLIAVLDEGFQKVLPYRVYETRDIITNLVSAAFGIMLFIIR